MRARPLPLATLLVLWGTTLLAGAVAADADDTTPVTDVVVEVGSHPPERVLLRIQDATSGATVYEIGFRPKPDSQQTLQAALEPARYRVSIYSAVVATDNADLYEPFAWKYPVDLTECGTHSRLTIHLERGHKTVHYQDTGCLDMPDAALRLAQQAKEAPIVHDLEGIGLAAGDTPASGRWFATQRLDPESADSQHETASGDEIVWFGRDHPTPILDVAAVPPGTHWVRTLKAHSDADGAPRGKWSEGLVAYDAATGDTLGASYDGWSFGMSATLQPYWRATSVVTYQHAAPFPACLAVAATDVDKPMTLVQLARCIRAPEDATWHVTDAPNDETTVPASTRLVATWPHPAGDGLAVVTYVDSGHVPASVRVYDRTESGIVTYRGAWLDAHSTTADDGATTYAGTAPFSATPWTTQPLVPLDPMRGPAASDPTGDPFPFSLAAAADAARAHPILAPRLDSIDENGGVLAAAVYQHDPTLTRIDHVTASDTTRSTQPTWHLLFADRTGERLTVVCRAGLDAMLDDARNHCRTDDSGTIPMYLGSAPDMDRSDLPSRSVSWQTAKTLWQGMGTEGDTTSARFGLYRTWDEGPDTFRHDKGFLAVGDDLRQLAYVTSGSPVPREVHLDLASGAPLLYRLTRIEADEAPPVPEPSRSAPIAGGATEPGPHRPVAHDISAVAFVAGASVLAVGYAWHRLRSGRLLPHFPLLFLWARRDEPGDQHPIRVAILETVTENPGIIRARLKGGLRVRNGQLDHHLDVLRSRGEIFEIRERGARCFFRTGLVDNDQAMRIAALANPRVRAARDLVSAQPGLTVTGISERLNVSKGHASRLVRRLADAGHVRIERDGNRVLAYPSRIRTDPTTPKPGEVA